MIDTLAIIDILESVKGKLDDNPIVSVVVGKDGFIVTAATMITNAQDYNLSLELPFYKLDRTKHPDDVAACFVELFVRKWNSNIKEINELPLATGFNY